MLEKLVSLELGRMIVLQNHDDDGFHWRPMPFEMPHALGRSEEYQKWPPSLRVDAMMPDTEKT